MPNNAIKYTPVIIGDPVEQIQALFSPIVAQQKFEELWGRMALAIRVKNIADVAGQFYFSWILYTELWKDAVDRGWYDPVTHDLFNTRDDAPADMQSRLQWREVARFPTVSSFYQYVNYAIPRSTFLTRHKLIEQRLLMWKIANNGENISVEEFVRIIEGVVAAPSLSSAFTHAKSVYVNSNTEIIDTDNEGLITTLMGDDYPEVNTPEFKQAFASAMIEKLQEAENIVMEGGARVSTVLANVKRTILNMPSVRYGFFLKNSDDLRITVELPNDEDGNLQPDYIIKLVPMTLAGEILNWDEVMPFAREKILSRLGIGLPRDF